MQFVLEFGTDAAPTLIEAALGASPAPRSVEVLYTDKAAYEPLADGAADLKMMATRGVISSFIVRPSVGPIRYVLGLSPHFEGESFSCWLGTIEFTSSDYRPLWEYFLARHDLLFVCLGFEEGATILEDRETNRWFSWSDPTLVLGAVYTRAGLWDVGHGPRYEEVASSERHC